MDTMGKVMIKKLGRKHRWWLGFSRDGPRFHIRRFTTLVTVMPSTGTFTGGYIDLSLTLSLHNACQVHFEIE